MISAKPGQVEIVTSSSSLSSGLSQPEAFVEAHGILHPVGNSQISSNNGNFQLRYFASENHLQGSNASKLNNDRQPWTVSNQNSVESIKNPPPYSAFKAKSNFRSPHSSIGGNNCSTEKNIDHAVISGHAYAQNHLYYHPSSQKNGFEIFPDFSRASIASSGYSRCSVTSLGSDGGVGNSRFVDHINSTYLSRGSLGSEHNRESANHYVSDPTRYHGIPGLSENFVMNSASNSSGIPPPRPPKTHKSYRESQPSPPPYPAGTRIGYNGQHLGYQHPNTELASNHALCSAYSSFPFTERRFSIAGSQCGSRSSVASDFLELCQQFDQGARISISSQSASTPINTVGDKDILPSNEPPPPYHGPHNMEPSPSPVMSNGKEFLIQESQFQNWQRGEQSDLSSVLLPSTLEYQVPCDLPTPIFHENSIPDVSVRSFGSGSLSHHNSFNSRTTFNDSPSSYYAICHSCGKKILSAGNACQALGKLFHSDCFKCSACGRELRDRNFYRVHSEVYCEDDYNFSGFHQSAERCATCGHIIVDAYLRALGNAYHAQCFRCSMCNECLDGVSFTVDVAQNVYCLRDFHLAFAPRCNVCGDPILPAEGSDETVRVVSMDRDYHIDCYKCENCHVLLTDESGRQCYPLNGHILCKDCHIRKRDSLSDASSYTSPSITPTSNVSECPPQLPPRSSGGQTWSIGHTLPRNTRGSLPPKPVSYVPVSQTLDSSSLNSKPVHCSVKADI